MEQLVGPEQLSRRHSEYEPRSNNHIEMVPNQQHKLFMSGAFSKPLAADDAPYFQRAEAQTMPTKTHGHEMAEVLESAQGPNKALGFGKTMTVGQLKPARAGELGGQSIVLSADDQTMGHQFKQNPELAAGCDSARNHADGPSQARM